MAVETPEPQVTGATYLPLVQQLESSADDARSPKGAVGRFQIMPGTARQYGFDPAQLFDPKTNEAAATAILSDLHQRFSGNTQDILVAYNAGPGMARRWIAGGRNPSDLPGETQAYLSHASQIMSGGGLPTEPHVITATNATPSMPPKAPALAPGERDIFDLRSSGKFTDQQISQYFADTTTKLMNAGFKPDTISDYWGERAPKQAIIDAYVDRNIRAAVAGKNAPEIANSPIEAFKAGWDNSATALTGATQLPNTVLPEHAPLLNTVMAGTGRMVGDLPFMIEGAVLGGAAGLTTGPGALITAGMGAMGVPAAVREIYLDRLRAKEIHDPMQFTAMIGRSLMDTASQTAIGGLSAGAGGAVEAGVSEITGAIAGPGIGKFAGGVANTTTNAATFTALSAAAAGKMPSADDAITTAILALGMHGAVELGGKIVPTQGARDLAANMEKIWAATGLTPKEQFDLGRTDRVLGQETMAQDPSGEPVIPNLQQHAPPEPEPYNALTPLKEGGSGPPKPPPPEPEIIPPEPGDKKIETDRAPATEAELNERASEFIGAAKPDPWWKRLLPDFAKFYNQWVSELGDARQVDRELANQGKYDPKTQLGLEDMLRQTFASDSRASLMVTHGGVDAISLERRPEVPSLMDAIRAVKEDSKGHNDETSVVDAWTNYMVAQRANVLEDRGLVTGHPLSRAERDELIAFGDKKFARGTEMWNRAMDGALDYGRDSGVFSQIQVDAMRRDNPMYISFRRLAGDPSLPKPKGRTFKTFEPVKTYEGSDGQIVNPLLASLENMYAIVRAADRNRAVGAFVNLEQTRGVAPADLGLQKLAYQPNATVAEPGSDTFKPYAVNDQTAYEPWLAVRQARRSADPNTFMYLRDGKPEWWRAEDEDFARLIRGSDSPGQADIFTTAAQKIAALSRAGIVGAIDFPLRILGVRHPLGAYIFDPAHPNPILSFIKGVVPALTKNGLWEDWIAKGGGAALTDIDTNYMARDITRILNETGTYDNMWNTMKPGNWLNAAQIISEKLNAIGRIGYTELHKSQGVPPIKATTQSRVAWIDYSEKATAAFAQWMARVTPFMRADILGMDMSAKGVKADPLGVLKRSIYAVTIPNMVLYALNYLQDKYDDSIPEDQKYRNLQWYDKDLFYVLPQLGGVRIKIPNPFLVGLLFGAVTRRLLDHFMDTDLDAFDHWAKSFVTQFVPSMIPTAVMAPGQWWANKNWFTGYQLIPDSLKGASGPMQYTPYTTEASKKLSVGLKHIGLDVSPINLDQVTHDLFGTLGYSLLKAGTYALRPDDPKPSELADIPFVGSFLMRSSPGMSAEPIQNFYDRRDKLAEALKDKAAAVQRVRRRDPQGAAQLEDALSQITEQVMQAEATAKGLRVLNSAIQGIYNDPVKTREEIARMSNAERSETHAKTIDDKRQLIDEYTGLMITLARVQLGVWKGKRSPEDLAGMFDAANTKLQQEP